MTHLSLVKKYLFHPLGPVLLYLFMAITTFHEQIPLFVSIHVELLVLLMVLVFSFVQIFLIDKEKMSYQHPVMTPLLLGVMFAILPIVTAFINQDIQQIVINEEYRTLFKMILFGPCLFVLVGQRKFYDVLLNAFIFFYCLFGLYFIYRYLVMNEVRDFDLRPLLKIRHGDSNFLCTFFSMMIPLPLMQAWKAWRYNKKKTSAMFSIIGLFFLLCVFLTESRMGLMATFIGIIYLFTRPVWKISKRVLLAVLLLVGMVLVGVNHGHIVRRFSDINDKSNSDRVLTWNNGWRVFSDNPIFGAGMSQSKIFFYKNTHYPDFQSEFKLLEIHNTFLQITAELGFVGFVFFMLFFLWIWKSVLRGTIPDHYFLISSLLILSLSSLTIGVGYKDLFWLHLFFIAALANESAEESLLQ